MSELKIATQPSLVQALFVKEFQKIDFSNKNSVIIKLEEIFVDIRAELEVLRERTLMSLTYHSFKI